MLKITVMTQALRGGERTLVGEASADCNAESVACAREDYIKLLQRAKHENRDRFQRATGEREAVPRVIVGILTLTDRSDFFTEFTPIDDLRGNCKVADHLTPDLSAALAMLPPDWRSAASGDAIPTEGR